MLKKIKKIILLLLFIIGFIIFIYPKITNYLYNKKVKELKEEYDDKIVELSTANNISYLYDVLNQNNLDIYKNKQKTFLNQKISYENNLIDLRNYGFDNNIIGFLEIPSINVNLPIYLGANEENMKKGAVHLTGTSYPIGGINTNSVIAAHRSYYSSLMFRNIDKIKLGDIMYLNVLNMTLEYKAIKTDVIEPNELEKLTIQEGRDMVTIISCHPYPTDKKRYVVYFERA